MELAYVFECGQPDHTAVQGSGFIVLVMAH